ncbi:MAG: hypothetical protein EAX96_01515 [Candidatus Lokiarchaeota archaeon]|nr:hypothetical protein [Candidatus Lokiarchaeota archaeon]
MSIKEGLSSTLEKFKSKEDVFNALIRSFFSQSPGEIRSDAFKILRALDNQVTAPLSQKDLLKIISKKENNDSKVSLSSLRRRLKSLVETGLVTELVDAGVDARNIYYKISPEVQSILSQLITVLDRLEDRTNLSISEFLQNEIEKRISINSKVYTKKIRHGFILVSISLEKSENDLNNKPCKKGLCDAFCKKVCQKVITTIFPSYEFNIISEESSLEDDRCNFRYTIRPDMYNGSY